MQANDRLTSSYAVRHLGFADIEAGALAQARAHLEESVQLRRELSFIPGVAAVQSFLADESSLRGGLIKR